jgi:hypothetical protein
MSKNVIAPEGTKSRGKDPQRENEMYSHDRWFKRKWYGQRKGWLADEDLTSINQDARQAVRERE